MKLSHVYLLLAFNCIAITASEQSPTLRTFRELSLFPEQLAYLNTIVENPAEQDILIRGLDRSFRMHMRAADINELKNMLPNNQAKNYLLQAAKCNIQEAKKTAFIYSMLDEVEKLQLQQFFLPGETYLVDQKINFLQAEIEKNKQELQNIVDQQHEFIDMYQQERLNN